MRVVVVGGGSWGSVFSTLLRARGHEVTLACRDPEQARAIAASGHNPRYLRDVDLSGIRATSIAEAPIPSADLVVMAVPSRGFAEVAARLTGPAPALILTKGLDPATGARLSTLVKGRPVAVLSGPNHAEEIAKGLPAATVVASEDEGLAADLQRALISPLFRVYVNDDLVGVELCGAAKNVIALTAGGVDGLRLGDNAKAGLMSRGLREMTRLGEAFGARAETFSGLAGMGDLVVTCWSRYSRNRRAGELLVQGLTPAEAERELGMVAEGLTTAPTLRELGRRAGIELPITDAACAVIDGMDPLALVAGLMAREPTAE
jgi:glycerol-3-phosphate dehydrogenase (NAD(P)+)